MSHYTTIQTELRDKQALIAALKEIGYGQVIDNKTTITASLIRYDSKFPFTVNFLLNAQTRKYQANYDEDFGKAWLQRLTQLYGVHRAVALYKAKGIQAKIVKCTNGEIKVIV
jgi:hypothetical protein